MARGEIVIDEKLCKGCGYCTKFCLRGCIVIKGDRVTPQGYPLPSFVEQERCNGCAVCAWMCPEYAVEVYKYVDVEAAPIQEKALKSLPLRGDVVTQPEPVTEQELPEFERMLIQGNEAIGWGAIYAGCRHFFGYPITPQNEVIEWFARELPQRGGRFVQAESEAAAMNMLVGAAMAGVRVMTSTSSVGFDLMHESLGHASAASLPCVIVNVQRGRPGGGHTQHAQMDYTQCTRGGSYKNIVLAPASGQETFELVHLAFHLADKYWNPVLVLSDAIVGQTAELLEIRAIDLGPVPEKEWATKGKGAKGGRRDVTGCGPMRHGATTVESLVGDYVGVLDYLNRKWREMEENEVRYETYQVDDAELILVAFGYCARVCEEAVNRARSEGLKVGLIRPVTVWPYPYGVVRQKAEQGCKFLVVEDNLGQMIEDVNLAVQGRAEVYFLGALARHLPLAGGMILPGRVIDEIKEIMGRS